MAPSAGHAATSTSNGGQRLPPGGLRPTAKSAALSPRVRGPQRMVSASASLGGGADRLGVDGAVSPGVPVRTARGLRTPATSNHPGAGGLSSGTSLPSSAQVPVAIQPAGRSSLGSRLEGSIGAKNRKLSGERVGGQSTHGYQANGSVLGPSGSSVNVSEAEVPFYASTVSSNGYPQIWATSVQTSPAPAVLVGSNAWAMTGNLPTGQSPRVIPAPLSPSAVAPSSEQWSLLDPSSPLSSSVQGTPCTRGGTVVVPGLRGSSNSHSPHPVTTPWPRSSGHRTPAAPPRFVTRSASDMGSALPRSHVLRSAPPGNNGEVMDRGAAAAAVALLAKEAQEAKLESEFLRRIEALEAKVEDRDGLLAKLSRQQARLDRLETLARENEILKAQMRGEQRREQFDRRPVAAPQAVVQVAEQRPASKDNRATKRPGVVRQASGRIRQEPRDVRIITARDEEAERREVTALHEENGDMEGRSPTRTSTSAPSRAARVQRSSSSGTFSPPAADRSTLVAPRRMVSAPQEYTAPSDAMKVGKKVAASSELECRLEELELALGLQPGSCTKYPLKRSTRETNAVVRERSV